MLRADACERTSRETGLAALAGLTALTTIIALTSQASAETITLGADTGVTRGAADHDRPTTIGVFARVPLLDRSPAGRPRAARSPADAVDHGATG